MHAVKAYGGSVVVVPLTLISANDGCEQSASYAALYNENLYYKRH
jgi:hypothetical protein